VLLDLALIGIFGGFFIVPLYALVQQRSNPEHGARIIAANNIMNALFMVVGALAAAGMLAAGLSIPMLFAVAAVCNAAVALFIYGLVPEFLLRFIIWMLIHSVYRLRVRELAEIPEDGPAVIVCNHVSFVDALVIMAACKRPIRFVMDHQIFRWPVLNFVFRTSKAIPIASAKEDPAMMERAFEEVGKALDAGDLVGIFPEGKITADGNINPFRPGITPDPGAQPGARGAHGAARAVGQLLLAQGRRGDDPALPPRRLLEDRARHGHRGARRRGKAGAAAGGGCGDAWGIGLKIAVSLPPTLARRQATPAPCACMSAW
jgi:1-acyl-sn-glycerol-3-phosphate acyltransferase